MVEIDCMWYKLMRQKERVWQTGENKALMLHWNVDRKGNYNRDKSHVTLLENWLQNSYVTTLFTRSVPLKASIFGVFTRPWSSHVIFLNFCLLINKMEITFESIKIKVIMYELGSFKFQGKEIPVLVASISTDTAPDLQAGEESDHLKTEHPCSLL